MTGLQAFLYAIGQQESGGRYSDVNSGSGALGKYQVMPSNVAGWTKEALGHSLTPAQFLASPSAQEAVAQKVLGGYYNKYGAAGAASAWYSGNPKLATSTAPQNGGPSIAGYVNSVLAKMNAALGGKATAPPAPGSGLTIGSGTTTGTDASFASGAEGALKDLASGPGALLGWAEGKVFGGVEGWVSKLAISSTAVLASASLIVLGLFVAVRDTTSKDDDGGGDLFAMPTPAVAPAAAEDAGLAAVAL